MASNFLCHMPPAPAERCLRNIAHLVDHGGHLFVLGVDLAVRSKVARELGWHPVPDLIGEIHDGDPSARGDWEWWELEPLNDRSPDWQLRYGVGLPRRLDGAAEATEERLQRSSNSTY